MRLSAFLCPHNCCSIEHIELFCANDLNFSCFEFRHMIHIMHYELKSKSSKRERERGCQFIMSGALWWLYMYPAFYRFYGLLMKPANAKHLYVSYSAQSKCLVTRHARTHTYIKATKLFTFSLSACARSYTHTNYFWFVVSLALSLYPSRKTLTLGIIQLGMVAMMNTIFSKANKSAACDNNNVVICLFPLFPCSKYKIRRQATAHNTQNIKRSTETKKIFI